MITEFKLSDFVQGYWRLSDWDMTDQELLRFINLHLEAGVTSTDHADIYGDYSCETLFGRALKRDPAIRNKLEIVTKFDVMLCSDHFPARRTNHYDTSSSHFQKSVDNSLQRLETDHIDCLLIHRPDILMQADDVADVMNQLKSAGKVLNFGVSNFSPTQFDLLQSRLNFPLVTNQIELNPINMSVLHDGTMDHMQMKRLRPMLWSALAGGDIFQPKSEQVVRIRACLNEIKHEIGANSIDQVIYCWLRMLPTKPYILLGSGKIDRMNLAVQSTNYKLTREQWYRVWVASMGHNVP